MIGYLKGIIIEKRGGEVIVDCNGVGYRVTMGEKLSELVHQGEEAVFYVYTAVRDDAIELYGFEDYAKLQLYEMFLSVSGIGPKTALAVVGSRAVEQVERAVREADVAFFQKVPGIGKKGAQRIIVDLKGKLPSFKDLDLSEEAEADDEVVEALMQFGFRRDAVLRVVSMLAAELSVEEKIREGLKNLGKR